MIVLYTLLLFVLGLARWLADRVARRLENRYSRVSAQALALASEPAYRPGNSSRSDPFHSAKRQYQLALVADKRDRLEARHYAWQRVADRLGGAVRGLRAWKGRKLPYTFGAVDVSLVLYLIDRYGLYDTVSWASLLETARSLLAR
jgi:hypothetical protein